MHKNQTEQRCRLLLSPARAKLVARHGRRNGIPVVFAALLGAAILTGSCGVVGNKAPEQETVLPLLREEAQELKSEGETLNPAFGVTANWEIEDVQVRKLSNDDAHPWGGTIRFKITSRVREPDGTTSTEEFVKNFEYLWDTEMGGWSVR